ncbi:restriction endonuclease-related protein [Streptomyces mauvecolor]
MSVVESGTARERRDRALTACCAAAVAEADQSSDPQRRARRLMDCLGILRSAHPPQSAAALDMAALRRGLREGLGALLPAGDATSDGLRDLVLLDGEGLLREAAEDLGREHLVPSRALDEYWPWARIRAEQEERQLFEELRRLSQADYVRARLLLATLPAGEPGELWEAWGDLWGRFGLFEPVASWPWCNVAGWCFPCPRCKWPMRAQQAQNGVVVVRCDAHASDGVLYTCKPGKGEDMPVLEGVGRDAGPVRGFPAAGDYLALSRPVWRYLTLPGQMEVALRDAVAGLTGVDVEMYPDRDAYDLRIVAGEPCVHREWRVDAKAWSSPDALADALAASRRRPDGVQLTIAVPHQQWSELPAMWGRLSGRPDLRVVTDKELIGEIRRWCGMSQ